MSNDDTIHTLAGEAYNAFERAEVGDRTIVKLKEPHAGSGDWIYELVRTAHGDLMPDDWRYETISHACEFIHEHGTDAPEEFANEAVDVYTGNRLAWLDSNLQRLGYCDAAREEGLVDETTDLADRIGAGQYQEAEEIYASVLQSLTEHAEKGGMDNMTPPTQSIERPVAPTLSRDEAHALLWAVRNLS